MTDICMWYSTRDVLCGGDWSTRSLFGTYHIIPSNSKYGLSAPLSHSYSPVFTPFQLLQFYWNLFPSLLHDDGHLAQIQGSLAFKTRPYSSKTFPEQQQNSPSTNPKSTTSYFPSTFLTVVELRHTEVWTRDHLEWFNVDFDHLRFHTIPVAFSSSLQPEIGGLGNFVSIAEYLENNELLARVCSLVNEYQE